MTMITFANGLQSTDASFYPIQTTDAADYIAAHKDLYEITFRGGEAIGRAHVDIDGKMGDCSAEDFSRTHEMLLMVLSTIDAGTPYALMTSSKFQNVNHHTGEKENKLSYSMVFTNKCGSNRAVAEWTRNHVAPLIRDATQMILPFHIPGEGEKPTMDYIDYDPSVYSKNRKMRVVGSSKPNEDRPKVIHTQHGVMDTLISYIPDGCENLPEPVKNEVVYPTTPSITSHETLYKAVMALKASRADDRKNWLHIGIALHHSGAPVDIWEEFSKQSAKYRWGECARLWAGFKQGALTERTLWKMLKEDNMEVFTALSKTRTDMDLAFGMGPNHFTYAQHFVNCVPDDYLYDGSSGWWHVLPNKTWTNSVKPPPTLTIAIARTLFSELDDWKLSKRLADGSYDKDFLMRVLTAQKQTLQNGFCDAVAKMCQGFYSERTQTYLTEMEKANVHEMMDANPMLFVCKDFVYDFSIVNGAVVGKRSIQQGDFITVTTGYHFPTKNTEVMKQVETTLQSIWARQGEHGDNGETYEYVMKMLASTLCGTRWMEAFYILTGSGRNGKGLLFELLQAVMGGYYYQLPTQILTTKVEKQGGPRPDIVNLRGRRLACSSEPEANEKLQEGSIKYMTGGDKLSGRALYGSEIQYKPQFALFLQCNNIPTFNGITIGGVMRNRVIPFPFNFVDAPATTLQKQGNANIKNVLCKSDEWRDAMFYLLLDRFEAIRGKSLDAIPMPRLVQERTEAYIAENNAIGTWWREHYEEDAKSAVLSKDAFLAFKADTQSSITDKQFKAGLEFNLVMITMIGKRGAMKGKMGMVGWKQRVLVAEPGSEGEEE